jgi:hypothetical protein
MNMRMVYELYSNFSFMWFEFQIVKTCLLLKSPHYFQNLTMMFSKFLWHVYTHATIFFTEFTYIFMWMDYKINKQNTYP